MSNEITTHIDLLRHGEPEGGPCFRGRTDDPLTRTGWQQMQQALARLAGQGGWDQIITSPLQRCQQFAEALAEDSGIPLETDARLMEIDFGKWEGRTIDSLMGSAPAALQRFWSDPFAHPPPGAEAFEAFEQRIEQAWEAILDGHGGKRVLLIVHGGVIRLLLCKQMGMPLPHMFRLVVDHASLSRVRLIGRLPQLVFHHGSLHEQAG